MKYLEIKDLSHLLLQKRASGPPFTNRNWRESYYFNATDVKKGLSLITTIGILPNKGRCSGFVIIIKKGKMALVKLLVTRDIKWHERDRFNIHDLTYKVEGIDWRIGYGSKKCSFDILFRPLNEYYSYPKGAGNFRSLFSHHIEQAGTFEGTLDLDGERIRFGPSPGHRDHSWGIRDWSYVDNYWLFCGTFGSGRAFNLWKGNSQGKPFQSGYYFDTLKNLNIRSSEITGKDTGKMGEPSGADVTFMDEEGQKHGTKCKVVCSVPIPLPGSIVYETIAKMKLDNEVGYGLLERHVHDSNPLHKIRTLLNLQKRRKGGL